ncbi:MAG: haloacid dehalogenase type II [Halobacteriales archaeon]|nr:haloacid dehalogenase type II [Halobacteriales archaeon]
MALDTDRVETITFDSFSTLVDIHSARAVLEGIVDDPIAVADRWRSRAVHYSRMANFLAEYDTYDGCHRRGLEFALAEVGVTLSEDRLTELNEVYRDLDPFDDIPEGLEALAEADYPVAILSNGDPSMLADLVEGTGVEETLTATISADEIRRFKPAIELYEYAADVLETPPRRILHVSAGPSDVQGAIHAGMQGAWLDRYGQPWETFGPNPDLHIETVHELVEIVTG